MQDVLAPSYRPRSRAVAEPGPVTVDLAPPRIDHRGRHASTWRPAGGAAMARPLFRRRRTPPQLGRARQARASPNPRLRRPGRRIALALVALPYDFAPGTPIDDHRAGRRGQRRQPVGTSGDPAAPTGLGTIRIEVKDAFLRRLKVPELLARSARPRNRRSTAFLRDQPRPPASSRPKEEAEDRRQDRRQAAVGGTLHCNRAGT